METIPVDPTIELAHGISQYGVIAVLCAASIVILLSLVLFFLNSQRKVFDQLLAQQKSLNETMMKKVEDTNALVIQLSESARVETMLRIKHLTSFAFELSIEKVCKLIKKVRTENHIADHEATSKKIRKLLSIIHEDRKSKFDAFTYRGKRLSVYCDAAWIEDVAQVVEAELYAEGGPDDKRAFTNVEMVYNDIKIDFYHHMNE